MALQHWIRLVISIYLGGTLSGSLFDGPSWRHDLAHCPQEEGARPTMSWLEQLIGMIITIDTASINVLISIDY